MNSTLLAKQQRIKELEAENERLRQALLLYSRALEENNDEQ